VVVTRVRLRDFRTYAAADVRVGDRLTIRDGEVTAADPWRHGTRTILPRVWRRSSSVYASRTCSSG
jgi:hypothetical protein